MRNKKLFALVLGAVMVAGAAAPAFADGAFQTKLTDATGTVTMDDGAVVSVDENGFSEEEVDYTTVDKDGTNATNVYAVIGSTYQVTIPKTIVLKGNKNAASTATYKVDVDGDIAGNQYVLVQPDDTFKMKQAGKADVEATVAQDFVQYRASNYTSATAGDETKMAENNADVIADGEGTGTVSATLTAGRWAGTFNFDISLVTDGATETAGE